MKNAPYPEYKHSDTQWLAFLPSHWDAKRLKTEATYCVSNVDKVADDNELPIRLCNYTDVYYNDHVHPEMGLMETTATAEEIRKFGLRVNDVVITKDSEEWSDIAIPAMVTETAPDFVCGYHLAIIRPNAGRLYGPFLLRLLQSSAVNQQFQIAASGVTRYGLPKSAIGEAWLPIPPLMEQQAIARFLDIQTARIDTLVAKKRQLIDKLKEKRGALVARAVTRGLPPEAAKVAGLEPNPEMKDSGVAWLGDIPCHWQVVPLKWRARCSSGDGINTDDVDPVAGNDSHVPVIGGNGLMGFATKANIQEQILAVGRVGALCGNVHIVNPPAWITDNALVLKPFSGWFDNRYLAHVLRIRNLNEIAAKTAQPLITGTQVRDQRIPCPASFEQEAIADFLDGETAQIDALSSKVQIAIASLIEYRQALITSAVTGKIDVREAA